MPTIHYTAFERRKIDDNALVQSYSTGVTDVTLNYGEMLLVKWEVLNHYSDNTTSVEPNGYDSSTTNGFEALFHTRSTYPRGGNYRQNASPEYANGSSSYKDGICLKYRQKAMEKMYWADSSSGAYDTWQKHDTYTGPEFQIVYHYNNGSRILDGLHRVTLHFTFPQATALTVSNTELLEKTESKVKFKWDVGGVDSALLSARASEYFSVHPAKYYLYKKDNGQVSEVSSMSLSETPEITITNLPEDTDYYYGVRAVGDGLYYSSSSNLAVVSGCTMAMYDVSPATSTRNCMTIATINNRSGFAPGEEYNYVIRITGDGVYHASESTRSGRFETPNGGGVQWEPTGVTFEFYEGANNILSNNYKTAKIWFYNIGDETITGIPSNTLNWQKNSVAGEVYEIFRVRPLSYNISLRQDRVYNIYYYDSDGESGYDYSAAMADGGFTVTHKGPTASTVSQSSITFTYVGNTYLQGFGNSVKILDYSTNGTIGSEYLSMSLDSSRENLTITCNQLNNSTDVNGSLTIYGYNDSENTKGLLYQKNVSITIKKPTQVTNITLLNQDGISGPVGVYDLTYWGGQGEYIDNIGEMDGIYTIYLTGEVGDCGDEYYTTPLPEIHIDPTEDVRLSDLSVKCTISSPEDENDYFYQNGYVESGGRRWIIKPNEFEKFQCVKADEGDTTMTITIECADTGVHITNNTFTFIFE